MPDLAEYEKQGYDMWIQIWIEMNELPRYSDWPWKRDLSIPENRARLKGWKKARDEFNN